MDMDLPAAASTNLSPAQGHVLVAVKRRGEASAEEVAESLGITPSAVRQHLAALRSGGFVASRQERGRSGRPADLYHCTELSESLFERASAVDLSVELLGYLEDEDPDLIARVFERRRRRRIEECRDRLAGKTLSEKVGGLAEILDSEGYMADVDDLPRGRFRLTLHSCAIWAVASRFALACSTELEFMEGVLPEAEVTRVAHKVAGAYVCAFEIHPRTSDPQTLLSGARLSLTSA